MIKHKFYQTDFGNGFETHNAILDVTPYKPEVMIVGTFNPDTPNANFADFFYGRNYFWPAFKNLFVHNKVELKSRRITTRGKSLKVYNPTLEEILDLSKKLKLTFSDLILEVLHNTDKKIQILPNDNILLSGEEYNLIQDGKSKGVGGLSNLDLLNQVSWNTQNIINYLLINPQIKNIYFTRQPKGLWGFHWNSIANHPSLKDRNFTNIFTPSGQGLGEGTKMDNLLNRWIHNKITGFGKLETNWLIKNGVSIENF